MGVKPGSRIRMATVDTGVVERVVAPAVARPEGDPMTMTHDKLIWLFSEDAEVLIRKHQIPVGYGNGDGYVVVAADDILKDFDQDSDGTYNGSIIANLQDRFATYLVDDTYDDEMDSDEAVEKAEELIDDDFLSAYRDEFIASVKQECADRGIRYFDTHQDFLDTPTEKAPANTTDRLVEAQEKLEQARARQDALRKEREGIEDVIERDQKYLDNLDNPGTHPNTLESALAGNRDESREFIEAQIAEKRASMAAVVAREAQEAEDYKVILAARNAAKAAEHSSKPVEVAQLLSDEDSFHDGEANLVDITELLGLSRDIEYVAPTPVAVALNPRGMDRATKRFLTGYAIPVMAEHGLDPLKFDSWEDFRDQFVEVSGEFLEMAGKDPYSAEFDVDYDEIAKRLWTGARVRNN